MSIINVWKIIQNQHAISYSWIMFGFSIIFIIICVILLIKRKRKNRLIQQKLLIQQSPVIR